MKKENNGKKYLQTLIDHYERQIEKEEEYITQEVDLIKDDLLYNNYANLATRQTAIANHKAVINTYKEVIGDLSFTKTNLEIEEA